MAFACEVDGVGKRRGKCCPHLLIAQRVQKTMPTNMPMGKAAEAKMTSLALANPDFLPVKLAMKAIRKKPHWKAKCEQERSSA